MSNVPEDDKRCKFVSIQTIGNEGGERCESERATVIGGDIIDLNYCEKHNVQLGVLKHGLKEIEDEIKKAQDSITSNESLGEDHTWASFVDDQNTPNLTLAETLLNEFYQDNEA